jgi:hypothetical protein
MADITRGSPLVAEKTIKMNGGEVLILPEGTPKVIPFAAMGKEGGIQAATFPEPGEKKGNNRWR